MYNLDKRDVNNEKLLKKLLFNILESSIEKLIKELIDDFFIELNIVLKTKELYKSNDIL